MAKDPVCGMQVEEQMAAATSVYQGETYYFCAKACKTVFDRNPTKYIGAGGDAHQGHERVHAEPVKAEAMPGQRRWILVGVGVLAGLVLLAIGIGGLRELMDVGKVPPEMLGQRVGYTAVPLAFGLAIIVWSLAAGISWARMHDRSGGLGWPALRGRIVQRGGPADGMGPPM